MKCAHDFAKGDARNATSAPSRCDGDTVPPCSSAGDRRGGGRADDAFVSWRESGGGGKVMKRLPWMGAGGVRTATGDSDYSASMFSVVLMAVELAGRMSSCFSEIAVEYQNTNCSSWLAVVMLHVRRRIIFFESGIARGDDEQKLDFAKTIFVCESEHTGFTIEQ
jgi:hypothetical protein